MDAVAYGQQANRFNIELHVGEMDSPTQSSERTPLRDLPNTIYTSVVNTSDGGELTDAKELNRQCAQERYARMDKQKKNELLKKHREAYHQKKARVTLNTQARDSPSALSQVQSTLFVIGETGQNKENVVPGDNEACWRQ